MTQYIADESKLIRSAYQTPAGRAASFDGVNDYVLIGSPAVLNVAGNQPMTWMAWCKPSSLNADHVLNKGGTASVNENGYYLRVYSSGVVRAFRGDGTTGAFADSPASSISTGKWHHIVGSYDGSKLRVYVNGSLRGESATLTLSAATANAVELCLGVLKSGASFYNYFTGQIKDARIYNAALTSAEIAALYNATKAPGGDVAGTIFADRLIGWWPLEESEIPASVAIPGLLCDASGQGNHGAENGGIAVYSNADCPVSLEGELGLTTLAGATWPEWTNLLSNFTARSWTGFSSESKTTAATNVTWANRTGCRSVTFLNGALAGYSNNRVITDAVGVTVPANKGVVAEFDVALSRPLTGGETVRIYFAGIVTGSYLDITATSGLSQQWTRMQGLIHARTPSYSDSIFIIIPTAGVSGGDLTVYLDPATVRYWDSNIAVPDGTYLDGKAMPINFPALASDITKDAFGNTLQHRGPLAKRASMTGSPCATFDGLNDKALAATEVFSAPNNSHTVACWIKTTDTTGYVFGEWDDTTSNRSWILYLNPSGKIGGYIDQTGANTTIRGRVSLQSVNDGVWHHVAYSFADGEIKVFIDGLEVPTTLAAAGTVTHAYSSTALPGVNSSPLAGTLYAGQLFGCRAYQPAISAADIALLATGGEPSTKPVGHWKMSEESGLRLLDSSPNGNHLTAANMTSNELWANTQNVYHSGVADGIRSVQGRRGYRVLNGTNQFFYLADSPAVSLGDIPFWFAAKVTPAATPGSAVIMGQWNNSINLRSWLLYTSGTAVVCSTSTDGTQLGASPTIASSVAVGVPFFVFGYHDPVANIMALAVNGGAFDADPHSGGLHNSTAEVTIGSKLAAGNGTEWFGGNMELAAFGKPASVPSSWSSLRDAIYNGGDVLTYDDLTTAQRADWGIVAWYDCNEWGPSLRDRHAGLHAIGKNLDADYPLPAYPALDAEPARHYGTFDGASMSFAAPSATLFQPEAGSSFWFSAYVRITDLSANRVLFSKDDQSSQRSVYLMVLTTGQIEFATTNNGTTRVWANSSVGAFTANAWHHLVVYYDDDAQLMRGYLNGVAWSAGNPQTSVFASTTPFVIGASGGATKNWDYGEIAMVAGGKTATAPNWATLVATLYNAGTPLTYDQLEATLRTSFGLTEWFEVGDYDGSMKLVGRHAGTVLTGSCIPSRTTHGGPRKLAPVDTALNFTGGVAAPWTDKMFLGYWTCAGTANGISVWDAINGKVTDRISVYARWRNVDVSSFADRTMFGIDKSDGSNLWAVYFEDTGVLSVYDGTARYIVGDISAKFTDGKWHDILATYYNGVITGYIDGTTIGTVATTLVMPTMAAQWNRAAVLSNPNGTSNRFKGDIARIVVSNALRTPAAILSAPNILDIRFDNANLEDQQGRCASTPAPAGMTPAKLTIPTAYKHGVILPEGMQKDSNGVSESRFTLYSLDV
ncbi:MAG: hypothetical protein E6R03_11120 [Hyphomicrobiaceae bacterium]|nr:MAG: hypothetical protein E6R03_11120 [Hyphomicrobiaceae bacterium]